jgi:hypothetical protein
MKTFTKLGSCLVKTVVTSGTVFGVKCANCLLHTVKLGNVVTFFAQINIFFSESCFEDLMFYVAI